MIDDLLELAFSALAALSTVLLGFFFPCSPCCVEESCGVSDGKPRTDPANEGTWVPSGTWRGIGGVTWTFVANPGDDSGETWFFYGSASTSKAGGGASTTEQRDWGNICNWYSNKTTTPSSTSSLPSVFDKRATRLPPENAIVHVYSPASTSSVGPQFVKQIYFWRAGTGGAHTGASSSITATGFAHDSNSGAVFNGTSQNSGFAVINGGAVFNGTSSNTGSAVINGGAVFNSQSDNVNSGVVNGGAVFNDGAFCALTGVINGGAVFNDTSGTASSAIVNGGAVFNGDSTHWQSAVINGGAVFNDDSGTGASAIVNGGAVFNDQAFTGLSAVINDGAVFNDNSINNAVVNDGAIFNGNSQNSLSGTVNGGATFNDAACSNRTTGNFFATPCTRKFVAHPTDLPTCNGTAPDGCANPADLCGCG